MQAQTTGFIVRVSKWKVVSAFPREWQVNELGSSPSLHLLSPFSKLSRKDILTI